MYSKIQISGTLEVITGMHIGGSGAFAAIGAVDAPVIKDTRTNLPMIPGSSLKGKMRALLAKAYNETVVSPENDAECIIRLFGSAKKNAIHPSRIIISDMILMNEDELRKQDINSMTEVKFENAINRQTAVANPRQIERVIRGARFNVDFIYEVSEEKDIIADMQLLSEGMKLLQYDYLGGHGSRGYGKVKFQDIQADVVIGEVEDTIMDNVNEIFATI
ncbi:MAG: type III-A CRISPR-associated RAMP protein Csm3 [Bacteroides sp.]|nr:type III-A CRISPR-associated RAMP protein Csm3 [Bacteroides sp.]MCM1548739.1 type III-A CRISPR-associated RAMP protein Csm3 [Clostridium sp.]